MSKSAKDVFPETCDDKVTARVAAMQAFRKRNQRIDYYPSAVALAELERVRTLNPHRPIGQLIDYLVIVACKPGR